MPRLALLAMCCLVGCSPSSPTTAAARPNCPLVPSLPTGPEVIDVGGQRATVENGDGFVDGAFQQHLYDVDWFEKTYAVGDDCAITRDGFPIRRTYDEGFEGLSHVRELLTAERGFNAMTLQSPRAPDVGSYVALRTCILDGSCDFKDARIDVADGVVRSSSPPPTPAMQTSKSSFESGLVYFVNGDDVYIAARLRIVSGRPLTFIDLESDLIVEGPGPRLMLFDDDTLGVELKFLDKPTWRQTKKTFPRGQWVRVVLHYRLQNDESGLVELWQDGEQVISASGRTLPLGDTVLNRLELGITANNQPDGDSVLELDDLLVSPTRIPGLP